MLVIKVDVGFLNIVPIIDNAHYIAVTFAVGVVAVIVLAQIIVSTNGIRFTAQHITLIFPGTVPLVGVENFIGAFHRKALGTQSPRHRATASAVQHIAGIKIDV